MSEFALPNDAPRRVLIFLFAALLAATAAVCVAAPVVRTVTHQTAYAHMQAYIEVRADAQRDLFADARALNLAAANAFELRRAGVEQLDARAVDRQFDVLFPDHGDGTRRSRPDLFDGWTASDGDHVYGIGAYIGDAAGLSVGEKRNFLAAFHVVRALGEAHRARFGNLYFFDGRGRMVMYAPDRPDRLEFYRMHAPGDFDMRGDEDAHLLDPRSNPEAVMQCTRLSHLISDEGGERSGSACRIPVLDARGDRIGAFGVTLEMTDYLDDAILDAPPEAINILYDAEGMVISRTDAQGGYLRMQEDPVDLASAYEALSRQGGQTGSLPLFADRYVVGYAHLSGPDWTFVSLVDLSALHDPISIIAWRVFGLVLGLVLLGALIFEAGRWALHRLIPRFRPEAVQVFEKGGEESPLAIYRTKS